MGELTESCSAQRKSFVQQTITLVEQMPHQLPARSLAKVAKPGWRRQGAEGTGGAHERVCVFV